MPKDGEGGDVFADERAVGFRVRDAGGTIRVFPRGARIGVPPQFEASTGFGNELPPGYLPRSGSVYGMPGAAGGDVDGDGVLEPAEREAAIAALLTVRRAPEPGSAEIGQYGTGGRKFEEARLEPGDVVTVVGLAVPFGHVPDPSGADRLDRLADPLTGLDDPLVAAEVAQARATGTLLTPEDAWGNAAIPGFGIGHPVRAPELDPAAARPRAGGPVRRRRGGRAVRHRTRYARARGDERRAAADRGGRPRDGGGPGAGHVPARAAGCGARRRIGDRRGRRARGARVVSPAAGAAMFALGLVIVIVGFLVVVTYNAIVALRNRIAKAWANIDVALRQRHDQLPNLVEAVRGLMAYERDVLEAVTRARTAYSPAAPIPAQAATSDATTAAVRQLFAVVERYPEIKSAANVLALQAEVSRLEDVIADRRELYNDQVYRYNTRIQQLPANLLAGVFGWRPQPFFAADDADRARPVVELGLPGA